MFIFYYFFSHFKYFIFLNYESIKYKRGRESLCVWEGMHLLCNNGVGYEKRESNIPLNLAIQKIPRVYYFSYLFFCGIINGECENLEKKGKKGQKWERARDWWKWICSPTHQFFEPPWPWVSLLFAFFTLILWNGK